MKKYFMKRTGNEVQFGDIIALDFEEKTKKDSICEHIEVKFTPLIAGMLVEEGVVEERETENPKNVDIHINFDEFVGKHEEAQNNVSKEYLLEKVADLENRVIELEDVVSSLIKK